jgi:hypothetical protein
MQHLPQGEINDLKTDTKKWEVERQPGNISSPELKIPQTSDRILAEYRSSTTHQYRTRYGPTEEGYQYDWSSSGSGLPRAYDTGISAQRNFASAQSYSSTYAPSQGLIYTVQRYNAAGGPSDP